MFTLRRQWPVIFLPALHRLQRAEPGDLLVLLGQRPHMMFWVIAGGLVLMCCAVASALNDQNEQQQNARQAQIASKRPDALRRLFDEEYPDFAGALTYSRAAEFITAWETASNSAQFREHVKFFDKSQWKNPGHAQAGMRFMLESTVFLVSHEFARHALSDPTRSYLTLRGIYQSSGRLAGE